MTEQTTMVTTDDDALLTTQDVADRYRVHPRTVPQLVKDGRIPAPVDGWSGSTKRWLKSEVVTHIRGMRKREKDEQAK